MLGAERAVTTFCRIVIPPDRFPKSQERLDRWTRTIYENVQFKGFETVDDQLLDIRIT